MSSVLALRALGLGDALTAVPALRAVRTIWPQHRLLLAGPAAVGEWLAGLGVVDAVVPVDGVSPAGLERALLDTIDLDTTPEVAVNLHGRGPQSHHLLQSLQPRTLLAHRCPEAGHLTGPDWEPNLHEVDRWLRLTASAGAQGSVEDLRIAAPAPRAHHLVLHPGAAHGSRRWPVDRWTAVAEALVAQRRHVIVTGGRDETDMCEAIAAAVDVDVRAGRSDLSSLAGTIATAALLLSSDTGVAHLATAYGTPSVTLFGPVSPSLWGARIDRDLHVALWASGSESGARPGDPEGDELDPRLAAITVPDVLAAAGSLLSRAHRPTETA